jgi:glycosyltransferase involved in cell wall biosynthesis
MNATLISIVMPTYNRAKLIADTIGSILLQTYSNWELIIVDDGSDDGTDKVVKSLKDPRIFYHRLPHGHGMIDRLRNYGIRQSNGEFIVLADSDDLWNVNRLAIQFDLMKKYSQASYSFTHAYEFDNKNTWSVDTVFIKRNSDMDNVYVGRLFLLMLEGNYTAYPTVMFKREVINVIGYMDESLKSCHGYEYFLRLAANFEGIAINEKLMRIRKHSESTSHNRPIASFEGTFDILEIYYNNGSLPRKLYDKLTSELHYRMGMHYLQTKNLAKAYDKFSDYLKKEPYRLNGWYRCAQTLSKQIFYN